MRPVDTSRFQFGVPQDDDPEFDEAKERRLLDALTNRARTTIADQDWLPAVEDVLLAFGIGPIIGLYLIRMSSPAIIQVGVHRDEMWLVVGDLPTIFFTTDTSPTPVDALKTYCELAEQWVDAVLEGGDLSECYDMVVEPTKEHALMLKSRAAFIREEFIPDLEEAMAVSEAPAATNPSGRN